MFMFPADNVDNVPMATDEQLAKAGRMPVDERTEILNELKADAKPPADEKQEGEGKPDLGIDPSVFESLGIKRQQQNAGDDGQEPANRAEARIRELAAERDQARDQVSQLIQRLGQPEVRSRDAGDGAPGFDLSKLEKPEGMEDDDWKDELKVMGPAMQQMARQIHAQYADDFATLNDRLSAVVNIIGKDHMSNLLGPDYNDPAVQGDINNIFEKLGRPEALNNEKGVAIMFAASQFLSGRAMNKGRQMAEDDELRDMRARTEATPGGASPPPNLGRKGFSREEMSKEEFEKVFARVTGRD